MNMDASNVSSLMVPTIEVRDLRTWFFPRSGVVKAVDGVSFSVRPGEVMGLVGESGSGKSITGLSILGLLERPGRVVDGKILFKGRDLLGCNDAELRAIRGNRIAMIFQDPMMTLNPVLRIDVQMIEAVQAHHPVGKEEALARCRRALQRVGIASPDERLRCYPHQFSGGMRQRVAIAIALLNEPDLIIADEPTTALDVTIQGQILFEMQKICAETGTSLIWVTHDLSVVAGLADTIGVMYAGRLVEHGTVQQVLESPRHPYTHGLIGSVPGPDSRGTRLRQIPGSISTRIDGKGCVFMDRCTQKVNACNVEPELIRQADGRQLRCCNPL
jgi:peptide/nickel transport system ATP-binding protein